MAHLYADFDENEDLEGNDDDIGALGSILSWDEEDEQDGALIRGAVAASAALNDRENNTSSSVPPDMVQFLRYQGNGGGTEKLTLQLPMPTPVGNLQQDTAAEAHSVPSPAPLASQSTNPAEQLAAALKNPQALTAEHIAQLFSAQFQQTQANAAQAHQNSQMMQHAQQTQQHQCVEAIQQTQPQMQQNQPPPPAPPQQLQMPFTADPNTFLQQLQLAQLQQQFQQCQGQPNASMQVSNALQQLQSYQTQAQNQSQPHVSAPTGPVMSQSPAPAATKPRNPLKKKAKTASSSAKKPSKATPQAAGSTATSLLGIVSASDTDADLSKGKSTAAQKKQKSSEPPDLSHLSPAQKAKANRDRNREHARNTRLRKKAYLEKLKATVDDLCRERDTLVSERAGAANLLVEMHNTRTEVLMSFFALRSANEKRRELWASILDESSFACTLPVTPYRPFPTSEVQLSKCQRTIQGIDGIMADTASLHVVLDSLVDRSKYPQGKVEVRYTLVTEEAVVAGNQMMARWVMTTTNATQLGIAMDISKQGMLCCKFNSAHKIIGVELLFDVMSFMLQVKQAAGSDGFSVIPNTVQACQRSFDKPMAMILAEPPYTIVQVNKQWEDLTQYTAHDVVGKIPLSILEGPTADRNAIDRMMEEVRYKRPVSATLNSHKKNGDYFRQFVLMFPLSTDSRITHYLSLSHHVELGVGQTTASGQQQSSLTQATSGTDRITGLSRMPGAIGSPVAASSPNTVGSATSNLFTSQNSTISQAQMPPPRQATLLNVPR